MPNIKITDKSEKLIKEFDLDIDKIIESHCENIDDEKKMLENMSGSWDIT